MFELHPLDFRNSIDGILAGLPQVGDQIDLGKLDWKYRDSLPELKEEFIDDDWVDANHTESGSPYEKLFGKYYLYACDYGFCNGATIWRGHFEDFCSADPFQLRFIDQYEGPLGLTLAISGGDSFAASVWINDVFINTTVGKSSTITDRTATTLGTFFFPPGSIRQCQHNVITIVQDSMGMDQCEEGFSDTVKHPRGIVGYRFFGAALDRSDEIAWKVQGQLGGFHWLPDPDRGILNENGFFGIRSGWHLPNYPLRNSSHWSKSSPITDGISQAGIGFYHTIFDLDLPQGFDVIMSFNFGDFVSERHQKRTDGAYRVEFWVNGWHMGRYISDLGPQVRFPVHEGILNFQGSNDFALTLWGMDGQGAKVERLVLIIDRILLGGTGPIEKYNPVFEASRRRP